MTTWPDYNASLCRRGDITVWIDKSVIEAWLAPASNRPGRPATYSDLAIEISLRVKSVFSLALRQTQGFVRSVFALLDLTLPVPDYSTVSRRTTGLNLSKVESDKTAGPATLVIDSTGVKMFGAGEWQETKHGTKKKRRKWRKLHLGLDLESGIIVCRELTEDTVGDPTVVPDLLEQIEGSIATFLGDGAYDGAATRQEIAARYDGVEVIIPPPKTAVPSPKAETVSAGCILPKSAG
ncbi:IS5 family transposase [Pseudovibrio sp. Tun.PSC04-5.I4]|uniref:IS5 family transposase n=1 Tax=Pseudovibrio sp. Tun.PSC04-5.I4 TaxID=1798213 RepID=UPI0008903A7B|nr:IS5 family transposase [Pseudovibrio sp. Tun.PSC04-5.I4]SDR46802.1 Transposase DDE domain-containing protein [Pseudovibrio sp. Tun.PSC04-5.I4]